MNNSKIISALTQLSAITVPATALGLAFNAPALALFAAAAGVLVLLIAAADYAPRATYSRRLAVAPAPANSRKETAPLAA